MSSAAEMMFEVGAFTTMTPRSRRSGHIDVVESHPGAGDHLEARRGGDGLGVHVGGGADEHGVRLCQGGQQCRAVGPVGLTDIEVGTEGLDGGR